jgi:ABC-type glutathione transport system ATPase component
MAASPLRIGFGVPYKGRAWRARLAQSSVSLTEMWFLHLARLVKSGPVGPNAENIIKKAAMPTLPVIEIRDLHKAYGALEVLKGVSINAQKGDVISLIGSSGSGKSTLLRCCNLLEDSQQGEILFKGEPVRWKGQGGNRQPADRAQVTRIRTNLSMVFQSFNLWAHLTCCKMSWKRPCMC